MSSAMKNKILNILYGIGTFLLVCLFVWCCYWVAKTLSYNLFYEDMVQETIKEMVKAGSLK